MISSTNNEKIKELSKLKIKKYCDESNKFLVEGKHLVEESYKSNLLLEVFTIEDRILFNVETTIITPDVMKKLSSTDTIPSIVGVVKKKENTEIIGDKILLLDSIQDPGNLGTIIRSAAAFDIETIILEI